MPSGTLAVQFTTPSAGGGTAATVFEAAASVASTSGAAQALQHPTDRGLQRPRSVGIGSGRLWTLQCPDHHCNSVQTIGGANIPIGALVGGAGAARGLATETCTELVLSSRKQELVLSSTALRLGCVRRTIVESFTGWLATRWRVLRWRSSRGQPLCLVSP